ncbi:hypothetical protein Hypma_014073 [Hypsizygus marmoreus]|uniref:Uncharacterized protein n=1 Tax=Hypsizygus marmoreus TaxID=39966 RepID=A0A369K7Z0_HYPMA|nr:hypothetical protein Hypma_014073 [Hypsizygus marmoreus]
MTWNIEQTASFPGVVSHATPSLTGGPPVDETAYQCICSTCHAAVHRVELADQSGGDAVELVRFVAYLMQLSLTNWRKYDAYIVLYSMTYVTLSALGDP